VALAVSFPADRYPWYRLKYALENPSSEMIGVPWAEAKPHIRKNSVKTIKRPVICPGFFIFVKTGKWKIYA
jgi:hypothetical protein